VLTWDSDSEGYYAMVTDAAGEMRFRLIVERNGDGWGWTVLRPSQQGTSAQYGQAVTLHGAMWEAEQAAR
jgi:hypothetical protein